MSSRAVRSQPMMRCVWPTQRFQRYVSNIGSCPRATASYMCRFALCPRFCVSIEARDDVRLLMLDLAMPADPFVPAR